MVPTGCPLPMPQLRTLQALADGHTGSEIAAREGITYDGVMDRVRYAKQKLGVSTRLEAIFKCASEGWIVLDGLAPVAPITRRQHSVLEEFDRHLRQNHGRSGHERDWMDLLVDDMRRFGG